VNIRRRDNRETRSSKSQHIFNEHSMHLFDSEQSRVRTMTLAACALFLLGASACGGGDALGPGIGSGTLTANGAVSASGSGLAVFQSVTSGGTSLFQIALAPISQSANTWTLQIASYSGRLAAGTYNLTALSPSSPNPTATFYYISGGNMQLFNSTSGQLIITSSSPSAVRGSFTFSATDPAGGPGTVTAHGSFDAQCAAGTMCQ
jgi:hypothetical protein